jgi:hypothetical protein
MRSAKRYETGKDSSFIRPRRLIRGVGMPSAHTQQYISMAPCTALRNPGIFSKLKVTQQQYNGEKIGDCSMIGNCKAYIYIQ